MKKYILGLFLLLPLCFKAQSSVSELKRADDLLVAGKVGEAIQIYESLYKTSNARPVIGVDAKINMAEAYRLDKQGDKCRNLLKDIISYKDQRPDILLCLAKLEMDEEQFSKSKNYFVEYLKKRPSDAKAKALLDQVEAISKVKAVYPNASIQIQSKASEQNFDEIAATFFKKGVVFCSDRIPKNDVVSNWGEKDKAPLDLYYAEFSYDGSLNQPSSLSKKLNSLYRIDGPISFNKEQKYAVYSQSVKNPNDNNLFLQQLFSSKFGIIDWEEPKLLDFINPAYNYIHPSLSIDAKTLYFSSDMPGGKGGYDIWYSQYSNGKWSLPKNMGVEINTKADEMHPFIHANGTLYFSSTGHVGYGGFDLFYSKPTGNGIDWIQAANIGKPINSSFDEKSICFSEDFGIGYLSAKKDKSFDLYLIKTNLNQKNLNTKSKDKKSLDKKKQDEAILDSLLRIESEKEKAGQGDGSFLDESNYFEKNEIKIQGEKTSIKLNINDLCCRYSNFSFLDKKNIQFFEIIYSIQPTLSEITPLSILNKGFC